jgi:hypothetical protein
MVLGEAQDAPSIGQMSKGPVAQMRFQSLANGYKISGLLVGNGIPTGVFAYHQMGENRLNVQACALAILGQSRPIALGVKAQAVHARINFQMQRAVSTF